MGDLSLYQTLGRKIGVMDRKIIRKAAELKNLLNVRAGSVSVATLRLTDTASVILCLDMAGMLLSHPVNKAEATKLSGLKKSAYQVALKTLESVLELNTKTNMRDLAIRFGCLQVLDAAARLLSRYETEQCCDVDTNSSLFQTAALLCICKRQKVRIEQARLREVSGVKRSTMDRLITQMEKIAETLEEEDNRQKRKISRKKRDLMDDIEKAMNTSSSDSPQPKRSKTEKDISYCKNVTFDEWRRKLLEQAATEMDECKA
ncbi:origin recognition complex subunit 6-like [Littorina saxatilis]|uniref:Origin recognition complex subunit 6 n=1 Tax=Littorina saxatilis TaxID=31220 RepID=A0AAN9C048_9CAEN